MKKQYQLSEFQFYDGEEFITFNLIDINTEKKEIIYDFASLKADRDSKRKHFGTL